MARVQMRVNRAALRNQKHPSCRGCYDHPDGRVGFRAMFAGEPVICWYQQCAAYGGYEFAGTTHGAQGAKYRGL